MADKSKDQAKRRVLRGLGEKLLSLVQKGADSKQWAKWLRLPLEHALAKEKLETAKNSSRPVLPAVRGGGV